MLSVSAGCIAGTDLVVLIYSVLPAFLVGCVSCNCYHVGPDVVYG